MGGAGHHLCLIIRLLLIIVSVNAFKLLPEIYRGPLSTCVWIMVKIKNRLVKAVIISSKQVISALSQSNYNHFNTLKCI